MISKQMNDELNQQINRELYSAYLYQAMSAFAGFKGYKGTANWFAVQAKEELGHVTRFYDYINSQGGQVIFDAIDKPPSEFESVRSMFDDSLEHERMITSCVNRLTDLAVEEKDHATQIFLEWFVTEQVEEEESVNDIISSLELAGPAGLFFVDKELASRTFKPAPAN